MSASLSHIRKPIPQQAMAPSPQLPRIGGLDPDWASLHRLATVMEGEADVVEFDPVFPPDILIVDPAGFEVSDTYLQIAELADRVPLIIHTSERRSNRLFEWFVMFLAARILQKPASKELISSICRETLARTGKGQQDRQLLDTILWLCLQSGVDILHPYGEDLARNLRALITGRFRHAPKTIQVDRLLTAPLRENMPALRKRKIELETEILVACVHGDSALLENLVGVMMQVALHCMRPEGRLTLSICEGISRRRILLAGFGRIRAPSDSYALAEAFLRMGAETHNGRYEFSQNTRNLRAALHLPVPNPGRGDAV